jgi:hypothetical protein
VGFSEEIEGVAMIISPGYLARRELGAVAMYGVPSP